MNAKPIESKSDGIGVRSCKGQKPQVAKTGPPAEVAPKDRSAKAVEPVLPKRAALLDAFYHWVMSRS